MASELQWLSQKHNEMDDTVTSACALSSACSERMEHSDPFVPCHNAHGYSHDQNQSRQIRDSGPRFYEDLSHKVRPEASSHVSPMCCLAVRASLEPTTQ